MTLPVTSERPPDPERKPLPLLVGETYRYVPTGELVEVVDFEYRKRADTRPCQSARTGRAVVRCKFAAWDPFLFPRRSPPR